MSTLEIITVILSSISLITILTIIQRYQFRLELILPKFLKRFYKVLRYRAAQKDYEAYTAYWTSYHSEHDAIINAFLASKKDKHSKQQAEVVASIVLKYSSASLTALLKKPWHRYYIYRGLSEPNQHSRDTHESDYVT